MSVTWNPLIKLCVNSFDEEIIEKEYLSEFVSLINECAETGTSPLHFVALGKNTALAIWLLENGSILVENEDSQTPLHWACKIGYLPMVQIILKYMSKEMINKEDFEGTTALDWAKEYEHPKIISLLENATAPKDRGSRSLRKDKDRQRMIIPLRRVSTIFNNLWRSKFKKE